MIIIAIMMNSRGTNILHTFPRPLSRFLWDMYQMIIHPIIMDIAMNGIKLYMPFNELVDCRRVVFRNVFGLLPHPLKKLRNR